MSVLVQRFRVSVLVRRFRVSVLVRRFINWQFCSGGLESVCFGGEV